MSIYPGQLKQIGDKVIIRALTIGRDGIKRFAYFDSWEAYRDFREKMG